MRPMRNKYLVHKIHVYEEDKVRVFTKSQVTNNWEVLIFLIFLGIFPNSGGHLQGATVLALQMLARM